jgi:hypothetical protein
MAILYFSPCSKYYNDQRKSRRWAGHVARTGANKRNILRPTQLYSETLNGMDYMEDLDVDDSITSKRTTMNFG